MSEKRDSFVLYGNQIKQLETLSDEEAGKVIKNIYKYANSDTDFIELSPAAMMFFSFVQDQFFVLKLRDCQQFIHQCQQVLRLIFDNTVIFLLDPAGYDPGN